MVVRAGESRANETICGGRLTVGERLTGMTMCGKMIVLRCYAERGSGALFLCQSSVLTTYCFCLKKRLCFAGGLAPFGITPKQRYPVNKGAFLVYGHRSMKR